MELVIAKKPEYSEMENYEGTVGEMMLFGHRKYEVILPKEGLEVEERPAVKDILPYCEMINLIWTIVDIKSIRNLLGLKEGQERDIKLVPEAGGTKIMITLEEENNPDKYVNMMDFDMEIFKETYMRDLLILTPVCCLSDAPVLINDVFRKIPTGKKQELISDIDCDDERTIYRQISSSELQKLIEDNSESFEYEVHDYLGPGESYFIIHHGPF